jgi:hypothetical protein
MAIHKHSLRVLSCFVDRHPAQASRSNQAPQCVDVAPLTFCRAFDELRNFLRVRAFHCQHVCADRRRLRQMRHTATALGILETA